MNTANIKKYAPRARQNFIAAMTRQAALYGVTARGCEPMEKRGDLALIGSRTFPKSIAPARAALVRQVEQQGFEQTMEQAAYSWFNRLCAIRYMEIHGYLDHGRRVLSTASGEAGTPQILDDCIDIDLPGLDQARVAELKLDGTKDEELYRELLLAQCHALHEAMPFLFEELDDATELLLPDNLTKTDSLIRELVSAIPEEDWQDVEIIGWLYQFYISEKKEQVIGKVVKSEDIPAATQLFTPNWIVQYLVQNSIGRQWLQTCPDSPLQEQMPYYIAPGEQPAEVQAQLKSATPESIDPESIKVLDPAMGSGHILIEAYKLLKAIYEERGYRTRDIPRLILNQNLFGLDIDDRAGQLAGFALMMLARQDDRRLFSRVASGELSLNILAIQQTGHLDLDQLWRALNLNNEWQQGTSQNLFENEQADLSTARADNRYQLLERTLARFTEAKTFGSLIEVPAEDAEPLKELLDQLTRLAREGDSMQKPAAQQLLPHVRQAWILAQRYDAVIANPPYMGRKYLNSIMKEFALSYYGNSQADLYAMFIQRNIGFCEKGRHIAMICMDSWLSGEDFQGIRSHFIDKGTFVSLCHLGPHAFPEITGEKVQVAAFIASVGVSSKYKGIYVDLVDSNSSEEKEHKLLSGDSRFLAAVSDFSDVPRGVFTAYRASRPVLDVFSNSVPLKSISEAFTGLQTGDNARFIRYWFELSLHSINFDYVSGEDSINTEKKWFPYVKGSDYRKWYGNQLCVVDWGYNGKVIRSHPSSTVRNADKYFNNGIAYNNISKRFSARYVDNGFIFDQKNSMFFSDSSENLLLTMGLMNSEAVEPFLRIISPKDFGPGALKIMPVPTAVLRCRQVGETINDLIESHKKDWNVYEESWDFKFTPLQFKSPVNFTLIKDSYTWLAKDRWNIINEIKSLEEENNRIFIEAYGLQDELTPDVPLEEITLTCNPHYRYGGNRSEEELETLLQCDTLKELISYAIGCMMGRYSIDKPGLILASQGETLQDYLKQIPSPRFMPDDDAILPLTDQEWFPDDATNRFREFVRVVWGDEHLQENLDFVAESLCLHAIKPKRGESALDTIRRYLSTQFFKDHMRTYKKRPIYWLFSSGKQKAFECLVYLHRYNEGTLARMRTEYVVPLSARLNAYAEKLEKDKEASTSAAETRRLDKEITKLHKQQAELATFDEKLRHYADQRIALDLDDGVKVNYGKFGDLLAEVKAVTGKIS